MPETFLVKYLAEEGGHIVGESHQVVESGASTRRVYAKADDNARFLGWSDGFTESSRIDKIENENLVVTALFGYGMYLAEYRADIGGYITGFDRQYVKYSEETVGATAVPYDGYRFVKWSDGKTEESRSDIVESEFTVWAYFARNSYSVKYEAQEGGRIVGKSEQTLYYGKESSSVKAVPDPGYAFVQWSDGNTELERKDVVKSDLQLVATFRFLFADGTGIAADPYIIDTYEQMCNMRFYPYAYYALSRNINMSNIKHEPIFDEINPFIGQFDGNGYTVYNLTVSGTYKYPSLLGYLGKYSSVKNLNLENVNIAVATVGIEAMCVGALAGLSNGNVQGISASVTITGVNRYWPDMYVGGIIGEAHGSVSDCEADVDILVKNHTVVGGLIGISDSVVVNCKARGNIDVKDGFFPSSIEDSSKGGGLVGSYGKENTLRASMTGCVADVNIMSKIRHSVGGLIGETRNSSVAESHASGNVTARSTAGGFIGAAKNISITECYATGDVTGHEVSGFVFSCQQAKISKCYSTGDLYADLCAAAFIWSASGRISECFSRGNIKACDEGFGFIGMTDDITEIVNCYSVSNIELAAGCDLYYSSGLSNDKSIIKNCYYAGKISLENVPADAILSIQGIGFMNKQGKLDNCHWLYYEGGAASVSYEGWLNDGDVTNVVRYETAADMYNLADILNADGEEIWVNVVGDFPQLKWYIS